MSRWAEGLTEEQVAALERLLRKTAGQTVEAELLGAIGGLFAAFRRKPREYTEERVIRWRNGERPMPGELSCPADRARVEITYREITEGPATEECGMDAVPVSDGVLPCTRPRGHSGAHAAAKREPRVWRGRLGSEGPPPWAYRLPVEVREILED